MAAARESGPGRLLLQALLAPPSFPLPRRYLLSKTCSGCFRFTFDIFSFQASCCAVAASALALPRSTASALALVFFFVRQQARHPVGGGDLLYTCTIAVLKYPRADSGPLYHLHGANVYYTPGHFPLSGPYVNT